MMRIATIIPIVLLLLSINSSAAIILDGVDGVSISVTNTPTGWTEGGPGAGFLSISGTLDGDATNATPPGRWVGFGGDPLSNANYWEFTIDLAGLYTITDLRVAHDFGGTADQEIEDMQVFFTGNPATFDLNIEDNNLADVDDYFVGQSLINVSHVILRLTGEDSSGNLEIREFILEGSLQAGVIPEPSTYAILGILLAAGAFQLRRQRQSTP